MVMKIVVCIKQVPDTNEVKLDPKTNTLIREGVPSIINPDDKSAITEALMLKDRIGGSVTALTMGPPQADVALREALAMGCDEAVMLSGPEFAGSDTLATSTILAAGIKKIGYDIVLAGRQAIDGDTAQVGPQIAEHLGIPQVTYVEDVKVDGDHLIVKRQFEDRYHIIRTSIPCLLTVLSEACAPKYMTVGGIVDAYNKEVKVFGYSDLSEHLDTSQIGLEGSPTNVWRSFTKEAKGAGTVLKEVTADEAVAAIIAKLEEKHII
jgi:electron transfer flavoprotein beta subunit